MADFYYELHDSAVHETGSKYLVVHARTGDAMMAGGYWVTQHSNRIWKENSNEVNFVKHRSSILNETPVDMKEFMWIKLKAETLRG